MTALHERVPLFVERNLFVHGLLGLVVGCRRIRAFVETHLTDAGAAEPIDGDDAPDRASPAVYAVLGCYALAGSVERLVSNWAREANVPPVDRSAEHAGRVDLEPGELLR